MNEKKVRVVITMCDYPGQENLGLTDNHWIEFCCPNNGRKVSFRICKDMDSPDRGVHMIVGSKFHQVPFRMELFVLVISLIVSVQEAVYIYGTSSCGFAKGNCCIACIPLFLMSMMIEFHDKIITDEL